MNWLEIAGINRFSEKSATDVTQEGVYRDITFRTIDVNTNSFLQIHTSALSVCIICRIEYIEEITWFWDKIFGINSFWFG